jgi:hypothetical protein
MTKEEIIEIIRTYENEEYTAWKEMFDSKIFTKEQVERQATRWCTLSRLLDSIGVESISDETK